MSHLYVEDDMHKAMPLLAALSLLAVSQVSLGQRCPIPGVTPVLVAISPSGGPSFNSCYRGGNEVIFYERASGNLIATWYWYYGSADPNPRRITAAISTDGGQTWTLHENINLGVGAVMNAYYPTLKGTPNYPIIVYRNVSTANSALMKGQPTLAIDLLGWNMGGWLNTFIDQAASSEDILDMRYYSVAIAPDNRNLWLVGAYHHPGTSSAPQAPGEYLLVYRSTDQGNTWSPPIRWASAVPADSGQPNYVIDLSTSSTLVELGAGGKAYAAGLGQYYSDNDLWRVIYSTSSDGGATWSSPALIPGADFLDFGNSRLGRNITSLLDGAGNFHVFAIGADTSEGTPEQVCAWDFRYDGSVWNINRFVYPQVIPEGIVALTPKNSAWPMNNAALGPDGTLYYSYVDVVDTTGAAGDQYKYKYKMFVMLSADNGTTWKGPVAVVQNWSGRGNPNGMAKNASDKLHIIFREYAGEVDSVYYVGVPTSEVKARTAVMEPPKGVAPTSFALYQNFPNPFNPTTSIRFDLKEQTHVTLTVYNEKGQQVAKLLDRVEPAGMKGVVWDARGLPSGVYFCTLRAGSFVATRKMTLAR
ncbi:MAG: T9SS type A sorting domain-containing protein [Candidatus Oleimicrobiaceae bacterium]